MQSFACLGKLTERILENMKIFFDRLAAYG
jgi:hypothetical protein